jgi:uncharacterized protein (DUF1330 family)
MSAYLVLQMEVTDAEKLAQYREIAAPIAQKYGGRYLARGGRMEMVEGNSPPRIVIIEFPSTDAFRQFYDAPEYQGPKALRQSATRGTAFIVEGA